MTGLDLAKRIQRSRRDAQLPAIPAIVCSGLIDVVKRDKLEGAGIKKFLPRPFKTSTIATAIRQVLSSNGNGGNAASPRE